MRPPSSADSPPPAGAAAGPARGDSDEKRIVDLELRYMSLERAFEELSAVVAAQQQVIEALTIEAKRLRDRLGEEAGAPIRDERPPHY